MHHHQGGIPSRENPCGEGFRERKSNDQKESELLQIEDGDYLRVSILRGRPGEGDKLIITSIVPEHRSRSGVKVDSFNRLMGSNTLDLMIEDEATHQSTPQKQMWSEQKQASVHEEIRRMNQLPAKSTYVAHRMRVLN
ncbi:hypothetical protein K1719_032281 [Acacia pycnantha]|nr:hypothetical protein K1719_032281 [Acacia pycnantha]